MRPSQDPKNLGELLSAQAERLPNKVFLFFRELEVTYRQLDERANAVANGLHREGIRKGEAVALLLPNGPEFLYAFFAIVKLGAIAVPLNTQLKASEIGYILENSGARCLIAAPQFFDGVRPIRKRCSNLQLIYQTGERAGEGYLFSGLLAYPKDFPSVVVDPHDPASLIYTSGTTGRPKGVILSHRNYLSDTEQLCRAAQITASDRFLCILPLFHVNAQVVTTLAPLLQGGSSILMERFSVKEFFPTLLRHKATVFSGVPTILAMLLAQRKSGKFDLSSLRFCICGAAPMAVDLFRRFEEEFRLSILEGYGLSEATCVSSINPVTGKRKIGSIGIPLPQQAMKVLDEHDHERPVGEVGEIAIKGENVMTGYFQDPRSTAEALRGGWLHTGDLGYRDEEGYFFIAGRKKEMIIRGGENIYPREIEEALCRHPKVADAAVIGLPDPIWGETVAAVVIAKADERPNPEELLEYCRSRLADFKCPTRVFFASEFPRTATGKIQKLLLRDRYTGEAR